MMQALSGDLLVVHSHTDRGPVRRAEILATDAHDEPACTVRWPVRTTSRCLPGTRRPRSSLACVRCSMLWPDPNQRPRLIDIRDNLTARIAEAQREGWLGEIEGLEVSLAGATDKITQFDQRSDTQRPSVVALGNPTARTQVTKRRARI